MPAAKIEVCIAQACLRILAQLLPFLHKTDERDHTRAGSNHDDWGLRALWHFKGACFN